MIRYLYICIVLATLFFDTAWAFVYRWEDSEGHVHYSDQVPPNHVKYRRERINRQGRTVQVLKRSKTPEEIEQEQRLRKLRAEQQRLLAEQRAQDRTLLRTFRSESDLTATLDSKLNMIDVLIKVAEANGARLDSQLDKQQKQAATLDRNGKHVPQQLVESIRATQRQIAGNRNNIDGHTIEKQRLRDKFARELRRFKHLTAASATAKAASPTVQTPGTLSDQAKEATIALVKCTNTAHCDQAWGLAKNYVEQQATTKLQIDTDHILLTADPRNETDISLTVSKIPGERSGAQLFLSVRCKSSGMGRELCAGPEAGRIRSGFRPFIEAGLASPP